MSLEGMEEMLLLIGLPGCDINHRHEEAFPVMILVWFMTITSTNIVINCLTYSISRCTIG